MYRISLFASLVFSSVWALNPLPESHGISKLHPGDKGIENHPFVLLAEDFEAPTLAAIKPRWNEMENKDGKVLELVADKPEASVGRHCLQVTATLGENTGGHLFKRLDPIQTRVFSRFYVKFAENAPYLHHFSGLGGYNPPTNWPQGTAGEHAKGDKRFSARIEPNGSYGTIPAPGGWMFYTYWNDMKPSAGGRFWGNGLWPEGKPAPPRGQWQCVEIMVKCNDISQSNGELALWLDGKLTTHIGPGTKTGKWTGEGFQVNADGEQTFEGFRWRTVQELAVSYFMLSHYVTENAYRQNNIANPPNINRVWFDDIVVATEYIGPIVSVKK
ncbi:MAG TPA: hypothetical protein DDZ88_16180 [Verrucomicrobiales bacterium]|nr:hypothetical protein [Verrucomicrobiales bacterium]